jgi:hypothetical protein
MSGHMNVDARLRAAAEQLAQMPSAADAVMQRLAGNAAMKHRRAKRLPSRRIVAVMGTAAALAVLWLLLPGAESDESAWWLAPPAAMAQQVRAAVEAALAGCVTASEELILHRPGGIPGAASVKNNFSANSKGAYRRDIFAGDVVRESQWYVPEGDALVQTSVRFDSKTVHVCRHPRTEDGNLVERMRRVSQYIDQAEKRLGTEKIDGIECVGFVVDASRVEGGASDPGKITIWYDVATKLPVHTEFAMDAHGESGAVTMIWSHFAWNPLPANTFVPNIPPGFVAVSQP